MNNLEINKEIKQITFVYTTTTYKFEGTCNVSTTNEVSDINTQVSLKSDSASINIGNCSSNGSTNVNVYNQEYKNSIDVIATDFKALCAGLAEKYKNTNIV